MRTRPVCTLESCVHTSHSRVRREILGRGKYCSQFIDFHVTLAPSKTKVLFGLVSCFLSVVEAYNCYHSLKFSIQLLAGNFFWCLLFFFYDAELNIFTIRNQRMSTVFKPSNKPSQ